MPLLKTKLVWIWVPMYQGGTILAILAYGMMASTGALIGGDPYL